jgi:hypothetical protein
MNYYAGRMFHAAMSYLDRTNVAGFLAFRASAALKRHALVFRQAFEAICLDVLEVREQISAAAIRSDEAETFCVVEPFHGAGKCSHVFSFEKLWDGQMPGTHQKPRDVTEGIQTGLPSDEQDGRETDNNYDLMRVQSSIYR